MQPNPQAPTTPTASPSVTPAVSNAATAAEAPEKAPTQKRRRGIHLSLPETIVDEIHNVADALELKPRKVAELVKDVLLGHLAGLGSVKTVAKRALAARLAGLDDDDTEESPKAA